MNLKQTGDGVAMTAKDQSGDKGRIIVNTVINLWVT